MSKLRFLTLLVTSGSFMLALGLNCLPNVGGSLTFA